ncbi:hypothetical protein BDB13_4014 [Rhodococcus sp. OK302]|nr:hypothetical protein BDB13_4014 [Rhodococcus sp. OK302]
MATAQEGLVGMPKSKARSTLPRGSAAIQKVINTGCFVASDGRRLDQPLTEVQRRIAW